MRSLNLQLQQPRGGGGGGARPGGGARSVRSVKKRNDLRRHNQFHFRSVSAVINGNNKIRADEELERSKMSQFHLKFVYS